jgi:hypothetical protein
MKALFSSPVSGAPVRSTVHPWIAPVLFHCSPGANSLHGRGCSERERNTAKALTPCELYRTYSCAAYLLWGAIWPRVQGDLTTDRRHKITTAQATWGVRWIVLPHLPLLVARGGGWHQVQERASGCRVCHRHRSSGPYRSRSACGGSQRR